MKLRILAPILTVLALAACSTVAPAPEQVTIRPLSDPELGTIYGGYVVSGSRLLVGAQWRGVPSHR